MTHAKSKNISRIFIGGDTWPRLSWSLLRGHIIHILLHHQLTRCHLDLHITLPFAIFLCGLAVQLVLIAEHTLRVTYLAGIMVKTYFL